MINPTLKILTLALILVSTTAQAANKPIKFKVKQSLIGRTVMAVASDGIAETAEITSTKVSIIPPDSKALLYVLDDANRVDFQIVNKYCTKAKSGEFKGQLVNCSKKNTVSTMFKAGTDIGELKTLAKGALLGSLSGAKYKKFVVAGETAEAEKWVPVGIESFGLASTTGAQKSGRVYRLRVGPRASLVDEDDDGLVEAVDSDDDGDGTIDNYDSDSSGPVGENSFNVFSNLKLNIADSLNLHTTGLTQTRIDTAIQNTQSLAIQVAGAVSDSVELDCGGLAYCSSGGTGTANGGNFPGEAGSPTDTDGDGFGTITRGGTGDFQLQTHTTSSEVGAGDTFIQKVTDASNVETEIPGMLNFVFYSTPALKNVTTSLGSNDINYSVSPITGSPNACIAVPTTGTITLDITGWRPQRPGNSAIGEAEYVDIGKSVITADIPNPPCNGGGCGGSGPGNCASSSYSVPNDTNLVVGGNGIEDQKSDQDADSTNTFRFTLDLTNCLDNASGGAVAFTSGQTLFIDLQFVSERGDNAAQKFCVTR